MRQYVIALYIRLSLEDAKYDSLSIENQKLILNEFALSLPEADNVEIREFIDNGYTGTNFERPAAQELIELVRANQIDCIIVKDFSRFGRNSLEVGYFIERVFPLFHTRFISVSDDYDSDRFKGDTGGMDVAFKYLISEYYSRDMSIKTKSAKYAKMERGEYQSAICPYGYKKSADNRMEPDTEAAPIVKLIFELAASGMTAAAITRELRQHTFPTPGEYKAQRGNHTHDISRSQGIWSSSTVLRILEDERYTGTYIIGKRAVIEVGGNKSRLKDREKWHIIPDHHPAIVSKELFELSRQTVRHFSQPNKKKHEYPFKGKIVCGCCKHVMSRSPNKNKYYYCRFSEPDETLSCHGLKIQTEQLEKVIFDVLKKHIDFMADSEKVVSKTGAASIASECEAQIAALQEEKMRLYERYVGGEIDAAQYSAEKSKLDAVLLKTKSAHAALTTEAKQAQEKHDEQVQRQRIIREVRDADAITPALADKLIDKVYVFPDGTIKIAFNMPDLFEAIV